jgi:preprotein translocase subunit SecA
METFNDKRTLVKELHKPARINYKRRNVIMKGIDDTWQIDLVEMQKFARENKGLDIY